MFSSVCTVSSHRHCWTILTTINQTFRRFLSSLSSLAIQDAGTFFNACQRIHTQFASQKTNQFGVTARASLNSNTSARARFGSTFTTTTTCPPTVTDRLYPRCSNSSSRCRPIQIHCFIEDIFNCQISICIFIMFSSSFIL